MEVLRRVLALESVIDKIADSLRPPGESKGEAPKDNPLEEFYLGAGLPSRLWDFAYPTGCRRTYYKIDLDDFTDFATSGLPPRPRLLDFEDHVAAYCEGISAPGDVTDFKVTVDGTPCRAKLLDFVTSRWTSFVSVTARFTICSDEKAGFDHQTLRTMEFMCVPPPGHERVEWTREDKERLQIAEILRSAIQPPAAGSNEWSLRSAGLWLDPMMAGAKILPAEVRDRLVKNPPGRDELFELTRLCVHLPAYVRFMYDMVESEPFEVGQRTVKRVEKRGGKRVARNVQEVIYRTIKSIRILRPVEEPGKEHPRRMWTAPSYAFAVRGHWRHYADPSKRGHDKDGSVVFGKTWVTNYTKGEGSNSAGGEDGEASLFEEMRDPKVVIGVKQPLYFARDQIRAREAKGEAATSSAPPPSPKIAPPASQPVSAPPKGPSKEWRASERARLTAGLRYLILRRDDFTCQQCGKRQADENYVRLEVDHKVPIDAFGRTEEGNLWTLCKECNRGKSALT